MKIKEKLQSDIKRFEELLESNALDEIQKAHVYGKLIYAKSLLANLNNFDDEK